jgi:hypothetical protein
MQPGDLVRVRNLGVIASHRGKVGVVVAVNRRNGGLLAYDVLVDGGIVNLYWVYLEAVDATW